MPRVLAMHASGSLLVALTSNVQACQSRVHREINGWRGRAQAPSRVLETDGGRRMIARHHRMVREQQQFLAREFVKCYFGSFWIYFVTGHTHRRDPNVGGRKTQLKKSTSKNHFRMRKKKSMVDVWALAPDRGRHRGQGPGAGPRRRHRGSRIPAGSLAARWPDRGYRGAQWVNLFQTASNAL